MSRTNKRSDVALYESIASLPGMSKASMGMGGMGIAVVTTSSASAVS